MFKTCMPRTNTKPKEAKCDEECRATCSYNTGSFCMPYVDQSVTLNLSVSLEWQAAPASAAVAARVAYFGLGLKAGNSQQVAALDWKVPENNVRVVPLKMDPLMIEGNIYLANKYMYKYS